MQNVKSMGLVSDYKVDWSVHQYWSDEQRSGWLKLYILGGYTVDLLIYI